MYNSRSIGQVAYKKPLRLCNLEELAAVQHVSPSGGMLFARNPAREEKDAARKQIIDLFTQGEWSKRLSILTLPGLDWRFERKLFGKREGNWLQGLACPQRTTITSVENDRYIYYAACTTMPGLNTRRALTKILPPEKFAERTTSTRFVKFHFANIDDLMMETTEVWDAAWLDYTGPMTIERMRIIKAFFDRSIRSTLIITALKARWNKDTSAAITRAGDHSAWLRKNLEGEVLHDIEYFDTSPMAQFAIRKCAV